VAAALGLHDLPVVAAAGALAHALARRQLLLVLDNCEQVIGAAAEVCGRLLLGADDVRVLATSREPLRIAGEVRYRLGPLTLPAPDNPANPEAAQESEAVTLFADRARRVDPGFALDKNTGPTVAQLVARLDGMPLAIELAAASAGLYTRTQEAASLRHMDAEDVTLRHALAWAMEHDPPTALRFALSQAPMWGIRGRLISQVPLLAAASEHADAGSDKWCGARMLLGQAAMSRADPMAALQHYTEVLVAVEDPGRPESWPGSGPVLRALCLGGRSAALLQAGRVAEAAGDARRALAVAREIGSQGLEAVGVACLAIAGWQAGDRDGALRLVRQAQAIPDEFAGGLDRGLSGFVTMALIEAGDLAGAEQVCAAGLASCRELGDLANLSGQLWNRTILDLRTGHVGRAAAHLREQLQIATQTGLQSVLLAGLDSCGHVCAATGRPAEAVTAWAAMSALSGPRPLPPWLRNMAAREKLLRKARQLLGPAGTQAAEKRGAAMSLATAAEYALMLAAAQPPAGPSPRPLQPPPAPALPKLSPRERELITLVAIAAPTRRSRPSSTSRCVRSARTWTGSGTRPDAAAAPTSPGWPSPPAWSDSGPHPCG
jgi:hypothetical protein